MSDRKFTTPWVIATLLAIVGIISPILWDRYKTTSRLELQQISVSTLVEKKDWLQKLHIFYDGQEIDRLTVLRFILVNSGKKPIQQDAIVDPVTLRLQGSVQLLDARVDKVEPSNLDITVQADSTNKTVYLRFPLLNTDDQIQFSLLLAGKDWTLATGARIAGLKGLSFVDRVKELENPPKRVSWTVYTVGVASTLFLLLTPVFWREVREHKRLQSVYLSAGAKLPEFRTKSEYMDFIRSTFSYLTPKERRPVLNLLDRLPQDPVTEETRKTIEGAILDLLKGRCASYDARWAAILFAAIGIWYIAVKLWPQ